MNEESQGRVRLTAEELNSTENQQQVQRLENAQRVARVRTIGDPTTAKSGSGSILFVLGMTGSGLLGGLLVFFAWRAVFAPLLADASTTANNLLFTFSMAFFIGLAVALADAISTKVASKVGIAALIAVPSSIVLGLAFGALANLYYSNRVEAIIEELFLRYDSNSEAFERAFRSAIHLPRGLAWFLVGLAAGLVVGIASRSLKRIAITSAGGAIGGFLGGFIFDFITLGEWVSQIAGMCLTGLLIGASMSLLEQAARTRWIEIIEGGMAGKQFILYRNDLTIGSTADSDITLIKDSAIAPRHARIRIQGTRATIESNHPGLPITVNGAVSMSSPLVDGTVITMGQTKIVFRDKKTQNVPTAGIQNT